MTTHPMLEESHDEAAANTQIEYDQKLNTEKANHVNRNTHSRIIGHGQINQPAQSRSIKNTIDSVHQETTAF